MSSEFVVSKQYNTDKRNATRYILSHIRRQKWWAFALMIGAFANAALAGAVPYYIGVGFNELENPVDGSINVIIAMVIAIIVSQIIRAVLQFMRNFSAEIFAQRIERDVRDELYASLLGKSMTFHDMQPVGEIMARVTNDVREMNYMMNPGVNLMIGSGMFLFVPVAASFLIYPPLVLVPLVFVILHIIIQYQFVMSLIPIAEEVRASFGRMNSRLAESLEGLQVVKGTAQEDAEKGRFNALANNFRDFYIRQGTIEARYLSYLLLGLAFVGAFLHAIVLYDNNEILIGDIVAYIGLIYMFGFPVFTSLFSFSRIASGHASAQRILSIMNTKTDLDRNPDGFQQDIQGSITFENVTFGYNTENPVIKGVTFSVKPGQTVAIVGQTGSGKSTLTKLINRTYDTQDGTVKVDGVNVRDWSLESLRSQISIIEQDIFLFSRTIAQNIVFGDDNATHEQIIDSAKKAQAHDFIETFNEGYETVIGQRGVTLSGGQRQRLAIARAFQSDPPILILDDSTSAIDSATEDRIQKAIWTAAEGRTTIIITHRLSQIRWADHIIVIKQGAVVAQGSHDELLDSSEAYQRIFARYDEPANEQENTVETE